MQKNLFAIIAAAGASFAFGPGAAWAQASPERYGPHMMGWGGYGMFLGPLFMIVGLAVAIALALGLVRWLGGAQGPAATPPSKTALDMLKERFARGEIDKAEYEERRGILGE